jgi:HD-like signal output (HDOD) protein
MRPEQTPVGGCGTLEYHQDNMKKAKLFDLLRERTRERGEFPALKKALSAIAEAMNDEKASNAELAATVLGDFTLTQKVLKLANSATYHAYARDVTTVSRALLILGSATVAYTAINIQLIDTFEGLAESRVEATEELTKASFAGKLAREFATKSGEAFGEEAAVATLMYQLARLLVVFYFPDEWERIRELLELGLTEEDAFLQVLGVTPDELSEETLKEWSLPHRVIPKSAARPKAPGQLVTNHAEYLACLAGLSTELAQELTRGGDEARVQALLQTYAPSLGQDPIELEQLAREMFAAETREKEPRSQEELELPSLSGGKPLDAEMRLSTAVEDLASTAQGTEVSLLTQMVLESMMQGLGLATCVAFFRIPAKQNFEARLGFGVAKDSLPKMAFEEAFVPDIFHLALAQGRSIFMDDTQNSKNESRIPEWHKKAFPNVRSVLLVPLQLNDRAIGLLYGNWGEQNCSSLSDQEYEHLHSMRNMVSSAFEEALKAPLGAFSLIDATQRKRGRKPTV